MAQLRIDRDFAVYIGSLSQNTPHRHFAVQWSLALNSEEKLRLQMGSVTTAAKSVIIPAGVEHDLQCGEALTLLAHPLSPLGLCLQNGGVSTQSEEAIRAAASANNMELLLQKLNGLVCTIPHPSIDGRIQQILLQLQSRPVLSADDAADTVDLSTSRFLHLFKEQTGMPYRRMLIWNRLMIFFAHLQAGSDITTAAIDAGFADSAHLSRSIRQAFGLTAREISGALSSDPLSKKRHR